MKRENRTIYLDLLRIIACYSVIIIHTAAVHWYKTDVNSFEWSVFNFYDAISRWAVPAFAMISGALLLNPSYSINIQKLYKKNILKMIISYFCWSLIYVLWTYRKDFFSKPITPMIVAFIQGHYHMWYIPMVIGLYMITPIVKEIVKNSHITKYYLLISFFACILIPSCKDIFKVYIDSFPKVETINAIYSAINKLWNNFYFNFLTGFVFYFVLGHYLNQTEIKLKHKRLSYFLGLLSVLFTIFYSLFIARIRQTPYGYYGYFAISTMVFTVAIFLFIKDLMAKHPFSHTQFLKVLSNDTLGIYYIHVLILEIITRIFKITPLSFQPLFSIPILAFIIMVFGFLVTELLKRVPIVNKWLV